MKKDDKLILAKVRERENAKKSNNEKYVSVSEEQYNELLKIKYSQKYKIILAALSGAALLALGGYGVKKGYDLMKENVSVEFENPMDEEMPNTVSSNDVEESVSSNNIEETVSSNDVEPEEKENTKKLDTKNYKGGNSIKSLLKEMDLPDDKEFRAQLAVLYGIVDKPELYTGKGDQNIKLYNAIMERGLVLVLDENGNIIGFQTEDGKEITIPEEISKKVTDYVNNPENHKSGSTPNHKTTTKTGNTTDTGNGVQTNNEQQSQNQQQSQEQQIPDNNDNDNDNNHNHGSGSSGNSGSNTGGSTGGDTGGSTGGDTGGNTGGDTGGNTGGGTPVVPDTPTVVPDPEDPNPGVGGAGDNKEEPDIPDPENPDPGVGGAGDNKEEPDIPDQENPNPGVGGAGDNKEEPEIPVANSVSTQSLSQSMSFTDTSWTEETADFGIEETEGIVLELTR